MGWARSGLTGQDNGSSRGQTCSIDSPSDMFLATSYFDSLRKKLQGSKNLQIWVELISQ